MIKFFVLLLIVLIQSYPAFACESFKNEGYYQADNGWIFREKTDFLENFDISDDALNGLLKINSMLANQDVQLIIALIPTRGLMHGDNVSASLFDQKVALLSYQNLIQKLQENNVNVIGYSGSSDFFYYKADHHWRAGGAQIMADLVAQKIDLDLLSKQEFLTEEFDSEGFYGSFAQEYQKHCDQKSMEDRARIFKTFKKDADLLGDMKTPDIVLIGTSNSDNEASKANFEGFLKQSLSADVLNVSVSGGGFQSSFLQYFASDNFKNNKPKAIIWEFPVYQNFNDTDFYHQAIPAVKGTCENNSIFEENFSIEKNRFFISLPNSINNENSYLYLNIEGYKDRKFRLTVEDHSQKRTSFNFLRSKFYKPDGKFFLDIGSDLKIKNIEGQLPEGNYSTGVLQICPYSSE